MFVLVLFVPSACSSLILKKSNKSYNKKKIWGSAAHKVTGDMSPNDHNVTFRPPKRKAGDHTKRVYLLVP